MNQPLSQEFHNFVQSVHALAQQHFPSDDVIALFKNLHLSEAALQPYIFFRPERYTRNLIYYDPLFELLLLCWGPGQASAVHGHEGEGCWLRVEQGTLEFTNYVEKNKNNAEELVLSSTATGHVGFIDGPAYIHSVANLWSEPAMSLHLYARPFKQCDIYDVHENKMKRVDLAYDTMYGKKSV